MNVAIYCRVSRPGQDITIQEKMCLEYCQRQGHTVYRVFSDVGVSGSLDSRPAFNELLEHMRLYKFDCVMVTKLDRLGRSLEHLLVLLKEMAAKGVHFVATTQAIDTSSAVGKLQLHMIGAFAEFERDIIRERTIDGLVGKKNVGKRGPDKHPRKRRGVLRQALEMSNPGIG